MAPCKLGEDEPVDFNEKVLAGEIAVHEWLTLTFPDAIVARQRASPSSPDDRPVHTSEWSVHRGDAVTVLRVSHEFFNTHSPDDIGATFNEWGLLARLRQSGPEGLEVRVSGPVR